MENKLQKAVIPKYKTVYVKNYQADIDFLYEGIVWVKDKFTMERLAHILPVNYSNIQTNEYLNKRRHFCLHGDKIYISSVPKTQKPWRLLIKYIPLTFYKILDREGVEMPVHYSGRPRTRIEAEKMIKLLNENGEYPPYRMEQI